METKNAQRRCQKQNGCTVYVLYLKGVNEIVTEARAARRNMAIASIYLPRWSLDAAPL